jgi:hypothetical protein
MLGGTAEVEEREAKDRTGEDGQQSAERRSTMTALGSEFPAPWDLGGARRMTVFHFQALGTDVGRPLGVLYGT